MLEDEILMQNLSITEDTDDPLVPETIQIVEVDDFEIFSVDTDDAFAALGEPNEGLKHALLNDRDMNDQHPITAITGLREELDLIESLKTVYSNEKQVADYYIWEDENVFNDDRTWRFVSLCQDIGAIRLCDDGNVFGVTVDAAAFVGGQDGVVRDYHYGLVATTGVVHIQCASDVDVGDYVMSDNYGRAKKSSTSYGFKVIAIHNIHDVRHAAIVLNASVNQIHSLGEDMIDVNVHLSDLDRNVAAAVNEANMANQKAEKLRADMENFQVNIEDIVWNSKDAADAATNTMNDYKQQIENAQKVSAEAAAIANSAITSADNIRTEAVAVAADAVVRANQVRDELGDLTQDVEPLVWWKSPDGTQSGIGAFIARADADSATLATLAQWKDDGSDEQTLAGTIAQVNQHEAILNHITSKQGVNGSTIAQVEQKADDNGASITNLVSSVDKYSVGEYSQAYGLTRVQAKSILQPGYVYIPTANHSEAFADDGEVNDFSYGYSYEWDGKDWLEKVYDVSLGVTPPSNTANTYKYWYNIAANRDYAPYSLYIWEDSSWKKVNTLAGNVYNRINSILRQTTNEIAAEVTNARGTAATLSLRLDDTESTVQTVAAWKDQVYGDVSNIATIKQTADANGASIAQVVTDGKVNAASIVSAINGADSSVNIKADHINLEGIVTANNCFQINTDGSMIATGGRIGGWTLDSTSLLYSGSYTSNNVNHNYQVVIGHSNPNYDKGAFYVSDTVGSTTTYPFVVTYSGQLIARNAYIEGEVRATSGSFTGTLTSQSGNIGGFTINGTGLYKDTTGYAITIRGNIATGEESNKGAIYITRKSDNTYPFLVRYDGYLRATNAEITGKITATSGNFSNDVTIGGTSITAGQLRQLYRAASGYTDDDTYQIKRIEATGGSVGGWNIFEGGLYANTNQTMISAEGTFIFMPDDGNADNWCGFLHREVGRYNFCLGADCKFQFGTTLLTESDFKKLLALIK